MMRKFVFFAAVLALGAAACSRSSAEPLSVPVPMDPNPALTQVEKAQPEEKAADKVSTTEVTGATIAAPTTVAEPAAPAEPAVPAEPAAPPAPTPGN